MQLSGSIIMGNKIKSQFILGFPPSCLKGVFLQLVYWNQVRTQMRASLEGSALRFLNSLLSFLSSHVLGLLRKLSH